MKNRLFITGDKHGKFSFLDVFINQNDCSINDTLIILGDAGLNYFVNPYYDNENKKMYKLSKGAKSNLKKINEMNITLFIIQGNHEARPEMIKDFLSKEWNGGVVYYHKDAKNILFAKNGERYILNKKEFLVIGGAYSVDKHFRLDNGTNWFPEEQLFDEEKDSIEKSIYKNNSTDIVLSHTCPYKYIPRELFLNNIDQTAVDNSMEIWLDKIEKSLDYKHWYFGHYHGYKRIDKMTLLFHEILEIL